MTRKRPSYSITNLPGPNDWSVETSLDEQIDNLQTGKRLKKIEKTLEKVCERLAILDDPSPERLEAFKQLQDAYNKYKFLDELCGPHDDGSED